MSTVINTNLSQNRGKTRFWLEGTQLVREGIVPGLRYDLVTQGNKMVLSFGEEGKYKVSQKTRRGVTLPVLDVVNKMITDFFQGVRAIRVSIKNMVMVVVQHAIDDAITRRENRYMSKVLHGETIRGCSLFHGGGILDRATHDGFKKSGVNMALDIVVERERGYLESSLNNNSVLYNDESLIMESSIELVDFDRNVHQEQDVLVAGIPCTGASRAGRSKNKTWGEKHAESHKESGAMFYYFLKFVEKLNPAIVLIENVPEFSKSAGMEVIRFVLSTRGYVLQEKVVNGNSFGVLEDRDRLCVVAISSGIAESFSLDDVLSVRQKESSLAEVLENIDDDSDMWKTYDYLKSKAKRDAEQGKGFKRQLLTGVEPKVGTILKGYAKARSTEPFILNASNPTLSRLLTVKEHCMVKGVPPELVDGLPKTVAHEVLGQSVIYPAFFAIAAHLAKCLCNFAKEFDKATLAA